MLHQVVQVIHFYTPSLLIYKMHHQNASSGGDEIRCAQCSLKTIFDFASHYWS
jgi:hypothetical protein